MHRLLLVSAIATGLTVGFMLPDRLRTSIEPRAFAATAFIVTNTNDTGPGSLRQAIVDANTNPGTDLITFSIGSGLQTITPISVLPDISDPVVIDGTTQPGFAAAPLIELNGSAIPSLPNQAVLNITAGNTTVRGLIINHFKDGGIALRTAGGNHIEGCYIGTNATGSAATSSTGNGITIFDAPNNTIGGLTAHSGNVISGLNSNAISLTISGTANQIQGNYIGTNATGTAGLGNFAGIFLGSSNNTVGGTVPEARNVIAANDYAGIVMQVSGTSGNLIQGNYIGTDASGTVNIGNTNYGIAIFNSSNNNTIGGPTAGGRNVVSGNGWGISIATSSGVPSGNVVQGNYIGIAADGFTPLGNRVEGLRLAGAFNTTVGGATAEAGNTIAFNGPMGEIGAGTGLEVLGGNGNSIRGNSIFSNGRLGIDLDNDGVTQNDLGDSDSGGNNRQNFPVITSVISDSSQTTISGTLNSSANTTFQINVYSNSACDSSGNGEGTTPFGSFSVTTDGNGNGSFNAAIPTPLPTGKVITATATDPAGNTSEFSSCDSSKAAGSVKFSLTSAKVIEDVGFVTVTVVRTGGSSGTLAVDYSTADITAIASQDYVATSGTLTFNDGETTKSFDVPINDDAITEPDETFAVRLRNASNVDSLGNPNEEVIAIQDHNTVPILSINNVNINEGDTGTTNAVFTVSLSAATGRTITVDYHTSGLNATSGVDFQPVSGTLSFGSRVTTQTITVPIIGDTLDEFDETFNLLLTNPTDATIANGGAPGVGTIIDNDPPPTVSISDTSILEGNSGTAFAQFGLSLSAPSGKSVCVQAATTDGTATAGSGDYFAIGGSINNLPAFISFDGGATTATLTVQVRGDTLYEPDETFFVNLTPCNSNVTIGRGQAIGTIINDDPPTVPSISITDVAVSDGSGPVNAVFAVTLSTSSTQTVMVKYATSGGTATPDVDFQSGSGTLTFNPGVTSQNIAVPIIPDSLTEGNETFTISLSDPVNATLADAQGLCTISDGPPSQLPTLSINDITVVEGDSGTTTVDFTVTLSHPTDQQVSFQYTTVPGTATEAAPGPFTGKEDYFKVFGGDLFGLGGVTRRISVQIIGDQRDEFDETFFINLSNPTNATIADAQGMATIIDNDSPPTLSINDVSVNETNSGITNAVFLVSLSRDSGKPISVDFATANGTATAGSDYVAASGMIAFNPGDTAKTVGVAVNGDTINEADETFFVNLANPQNVTVARAQATGTIINDDTPRIQFSSPFYTVNESQPRVDISLTRSGDTSNSASVDYKTIDDPARIRCDVFNHTAYARCDYATTLDTLTFAPGEISKTFAIPIIDDSYAEGSDTFTVTLSNATGGASLGSPATATVTIIDNDAVNGPNPILRTDDVGITFFVRQHYLDFLAREPEVGEPWSAILRGCADQFNVDPASPSAGCDRITVSGSFFGSPEFLIKGVYTIVFYRVAFNRLPDYLEFAPDLRSVTGATASETNAKRAAFANNFVLRPEFVNIYVIKTNSDYVNALMGRYSLTSITTPDPANPDGGTKVTLTANDLINGLNASTLTRAQVLRAIVQSDQVSGNLEAVNAFVASQYYGYLRRTPDTGGFNSWINYLNAHPGDFRTMVNGFMNSIEYRLRFGPP